MSSSLPLRLAAELTIRTFWSNCFILPSRNEEEICYVISDQGLIAFLTNSYYDNNELRNILGVDDLVIPEYLYVHSTKSWYGDRGNKAIDSPVANSKLVIPTTSIQSKLVVDGIHRYYSRQVLEPSIRGFLSILEKTFPRNDLYLFELLQNAVDDGAMHVKFKAYKNESDEEKSGLFFLHDGRPFSAMDCLGLASVGLSTKGSHDGSKRSIGFMGIGFKAVYKRFAKVSVYDNTWYFRFQEPAIAPLMEPSHGWVLKPSWITRPELLWDYMPDSVTKNWCHFQLETPRSGWQGILDDMKYLPMTIPPLLGRQAIESRLLESQDITTAVNDANEVPEWKLEWNDVIYNVRRTHNSKQPYQRENSDFNISSECIEVKQHEEESDSTAQSKTRFWQFLSLQFVPDMEAQEAYTIHTKRAWNISLSSDAKEETCMFFEVDSQGSPLLPSSSSTASKAKGLLHAILPTKLDLPTPMHWQGSWLLSVDRQEVQSMVDNNWNNCILQQIPRLLSCLLLWIASQSPPDLFAAYSLLPPIEYIEESTSHHMRTTFIGIDLNLDDLFDIIKTQRVVPAWTIADELDGNKALDIQFCLPQDSIWLPSPLLDRLPINLLADWFELNPFAANKLENLMFLPLWKTLLTRPTVASFGC